ncbi:hypothetical protein T492DRAFT_268616 [Pavlovales sp. CCMP2436]|nr:hypothetical protein T492DRAFT_268616 [Pavlovales sp. CCMP2436]
MAMSKFAVVPPRSCTSPTRSITSPARTPEISAGRPSSTEWTTITPDALARWMPRTKPSSTNEWEIDISSGSPPLKNCSSDEGPPEPPPATKVGGRSSVSEARECARARPSGTPESTANVDVGMDGVELLVKRLRMAARVVPPFGEAGPVENAARGASVEPSASGPPAAGLPGERAYLNTNRQSGTRCPFLVARCTGHVPTAPPPPPPITLGSR